MRDIVYNTSESFGPSSYLSKLELQQKIFDTIWSGDHSPIENIRNVSEIIKRFRLDKNITHPFSDDLFIPLNQKCFLEQDKLGL